MSGVEQEQAPNTETTTTAAQAPAETTTTAADKPADKPAAPASALEAVKTVMDKDRAAAAASATSTVPQGPAAAVTDKPAEQTAQTDKPAEDKSGGARLTKEEFDALPEKARNRFNELYRAQKTAEGAVERMKPVYSAFTELQGWVRKEGMSQEEFTYGLQLMSAVRNNPARAYEMLKPVLADLRKHVGEELPEDLASEVEAGTISKERAQELARARNETARIEAQSQRDRAATEESRKVERHERMTADVTNAIQGYENQWKGSDPDYAKKWPRVWERMVVLMNEKGTPTSREVAVELLKQARKDVEDWMRQLVPARVAKETLPSGGANTQTRTQPGSALEAARLGLQAARAA